MAKCTLSPQKSEKRRKMMRNFSRLVFLVGAMHKRSPLFCLISLLVLLVGFTGTAAALECPDFIAEDWDDKPTCAWIRNDTNETITVSPWQIYQDSGDLNDDYWRGGDTVIPPGELRVVVGLDNDGWGAFNYDTVRGRSDIQIGSKPAGTFLYMEADISAGIVGDFEYSLNGSAWVDGFAEETRNIAGTDYKFTVADKWNYARAVFDVFFTVSSQTTNQGNMGYLPPDTKDDPFSLTIMNYNTYLLLGPDALWAQKPDYCERAKRIADNASRIFANVDILVIEELASLDTDCLPYTGALFLDTICCGEDKPFRDRTFLLNGDPGLGFGGPSNTGGVVIMSRYPNSLAGNGRVSADYTNAPSSFSEEDEVHYVFREANGECFGEDPIGVGSGVSDCLMDKGFLRVKFTKSVSLPGKTISQDYFITGTHSQAETNAESKAARTKQYEAIAAYAAALPQDVPIIIVGDLNTEQDEINSMYTTLNAASELPPYYDSRKGPLRFSENYSVNYYALLQHESDDGKRDNFDWILYSNHGLKPSGFSYRYLPIRDNTWGRGDLSDHEAVLAEFDFPSIVAMCQDVKLVADAATCLGSTSALAFDGGSMDYDGDALTFKVNPEAPYALGSTAVMLTVDDASNLDDPADRCTAHVEVVDAAPPEIICPDDITAKSISIDGVSVDDPQMIPFFAGVSASDICDGELHTTNNAPHVFPLHSTSVEFMATDAAGNQSSCLATVTIRLLGDLNNDDKVTHDDIVIFFSELFRNDCSPRLPCLADLNEDGKVDGRDWEILYYQVINPALR